MKGLWKAVRWLWGLYFAVLIPVTAAYSARPAPPAWAGIAVITIAGLAGTDMIVACALTLARQLREHRELAREREEEYWERQYEAGEAIRLDRAVRRAGMLQCCCETQTALKRRPEALHYHSASPSVITGGVRTSDGILTACCRPDCAAPHARACDCRRCAWRP